MPSCTRFHRSTTIAVRSRFSGASSSARTLTTDDATGAVDCDTTPPRVGRCGAVLAAAVALATGGMAGRALPRRNGSTLGAGGGGAGCIAAMRAASSNTAAAAAAVACSAVINTSSASAAVASSSDSPSRHSRHASTERRAMRSGGSKEL
eukprot:scaffold47013_cov50-Phaeocystis_antarctica.AAC.2